MTAPWPPCVMCNEDAIVLSRREVFTIDGDDLLDVMVPFCREHGPKAGGDV